MAPIIPKPGTVKAFPSQAAFEAWLSANHARASEVWLKIHKKTSGLATVTHAEALDVALCWGWIDGTRKSFDAQSFLQRFSPRTRKSPWSQVNRGHVARRTGACRRTPHGQREIDAAKADGRWQAAHIPMRTMTRAKVPADLRRAIKANPRAERLFETLGRANLFSLMYRTNAMKTPEGRARKIADLVAMLARGETIQPEPKNPVSTERSRAKRGPDK